MTRRPPCSAFTLVEMLVVMAVIAILTGLILSLNGLVQGNAARSRAGSEIRAMSAACEAYKADNGGYPQGSAYPPGPSGSGPWATDVLDPNPLASNGFSKFDAYPLDYQGVSLFLWQQLSGHLLTNDSTQAPTGTNYAADFFKNTTLSGTTNSNGQVTSVNYIIDPFGNPYGYSTAGLYADQAFRANVLSTGATSRGTTVAGFNPTFDLWSTGGTTTSSTGSGGSITTPQWVKNW